MFHDATYSLRRGIFGCANLIVLTVLLAFCTNGASRGAGNPDGNEDLVGDFKAYLSSAPRILNANIDFRFLGKIPANLVGLCDTNLHSTVAWQTNGYYVISHGASGGFSPTNTTLILGKSDNEYWQIDGNGVLSKSLIPAEGLEKAAKDKNNPVVTQVITHLSEVVEAITLGTLCVPGSFKWEGNTFTATRFRPGPGPISGILLTSNGLPCAIEMKLMSENYNIHIDYLYSEHPRSFVPKFIRLSYLEVGNGFKPQAQIGIEDFNRAETVIAASHFAPERFFDSKTKTLVDYGKTGYTVVKEGRVLVHRDYDMAGGGGKATTPFVLMFVITLFFFAFIFSKTKSNEEKGKVK